MQSPGTHRLLRLTRRAPFAMFALAGFAPVLAGQTGQALIVSPTFQSWQLGDAVPVDSLRIKSATQMSLPFLLQHTLGSRWRASASGAVFSSRITSEGSVSGTRELTGITDVRLRASGRIIGDFLQLTLGLNVPTGGSGLSNTENEVVRVTAAPALGAQVGVPGAGFGGTAGLIAARTAGPWALALGAAVEQRGTYSPIEAVIAGRNARTELVPGSTVHVSIGADRLLGENRLTIGLLGDVYASDEVRSIVDGRTLTDTYQLGPTGLATVSLQINSSRIRDLVLQVSDRFRSSFKDGAGATVAGSSGSYLEVSGQGTVGSVGRPSLLLGLDLRRHSGLPVDNAFIGAGLTAGGATIGLSLPVGAMEWRPSVRFSQGNLKTEKLTTTITSITAGLTITGR